MLPIRKSTCGDGRGRGHAITTSVSPLAIDVLFASPVKVPQLKK
jgi:hypothetical protein